MKQFFRIEKAGPTSGWSSRLMGAIFPLVSEDEYFVEVQLGSMIVPIRADCGSIITEKDLSEQEKRVLNTINNNV